MTREEAIEYLHKLFMQAEITDAYGDMDNTEPYETAMDMAIEALEFLDKYDEFWEEVKTAGNQGREIEIRHGGRRFRIREVAQ